MKRTEEDPGYDEEQAAGAGEGGRMPSPWASGSLAALAAALLIVAGYLVLRPDGPEREPAGPEEQQGQRAEAALPPLYDRPVQRERDRVMDVLGYDVSLDVDLEAQRFSGRSQVTAVSLRDTLDRVRLDAEQLEVREVWGRYGEDLDFTHEAGTLTVELSYTATWGDTLRFTVSYRGEGSRPGFFFDEPTSEHPRLLTTDSWPDEARFWVPCWDYPNDKAAQRMSITAADTFGVLSNGRLDSTVADTARGTTTWYWNQERPHATYLWMLAVGPYEVVADSLGSLPVRYWVYPQDAARAREVFGRTPAMIRYFEDLYGVPYPWAKYDQVTTPHVGGGAEATSATILGDGVFPESGAEPGFRWQQVIAHEIAHQWWGDLVTMREWSHTWISESFATYSDHLYTRRVRGEEEGAWDLEQKKDRYLRQARDEYMRPIVFDRYTEPEQNFDAHTYPKGAAVLHMLRFVLGDEPFFRVLNRFLVEHAYESVDTGDFIRTVTEVTGRDLTDFFDQWLYRPGHPVFEVSARWVPSGRERSAEEAGGDTSLQAAGPDTSSLAEDPASADRGSGSIPGLLVVEVVQVQDTSLGVPLYRMPVDIGIYTVEGKRVVRMMLDGEVTRRGFPLSEEPFMVRFDEGNHLLKEWTFPKSVETLIHQLEYDDVVGRAWALEQLQERLGQEASAGGPDAIQRQLIADAIQKRARTDPFEPIRRTARQALLEIAP